MKTAAIFLLAAVAVSAVSGGSIYGEKEDAIDAVNKKFEAVNEKKGGVDKIIESHKDFSPEADKLQAGQKNEANSKAAFATEKAKAVQTAISKGKPASAIDCILKVIEDGDKLIHETYTNYEKILAKYKETRTYDFEFAKKEVELILSGLEGIKTTTLNSINSASKGFQALQNEFVKKGDTAEKQMQEIGTRITQINMKKDYQDLELQNTNKNKQVVADLTQKLTRCAS